MLMVTRSPDTSTSVGIGEDPLQVTHYFPCIPVAFKTQGFNIHHMHFMQNKMTNDTGLLQGTLTQPWNARMYNKTLNFNRYEYIHILTRIPRSCNKPMISSTHFSMGCVPVSTFISGLTGSS